MHKLQPLNHVFLSLGSNIEPEHNLPAAVTLLARFGHIRAVSSVWETLPVGFADQPNYLNAAVELETEFSKEELRNTVIVYIESTLGRVRTNNKYGPRTIDVDIVLFYQDILQNNRSHMSNLAVLEQPFVVIPLAEIAPDFIHPNTGQTLREIAQQCDLSRAGMHRRDDVILQEKIQ